MPPEIDDNATFDDFFLEALNEDTAPPADDEPPAPADEDTPPVGDEPPAPADEDTPPVGDEPPAPADEPPPVAKKADPPPAPEKPVFDLDSYFAPSEADAAKLEELTLDYPAVAEFLTEQRKAEKERTAKMLEFVQGLIEHSLAPIAQKTQQDEQMAFVAKVEAAHKDATTLLPALEQWIEKLPRHRQIGANAVLDGGSAQDVIALYDEFKEATGRVKPASAPKADEVTQKRLAKLRAVSTTRAEFDEPADPNDYDGAFQEALRKDVA